MHRITIDLPPADSEALLQMAHDECRPAKLQIVHLIREEARRRFNARATQPNREAASYAVEKAEYHAA